MPFKNIENKEQMITSYESNEHMKKKNRFDTKNMPFKFKRSIFFFLTSTYSRGWSYQILCDC